MRPVTRTAIVATCIFLAASVLPSFKLQAQWPARPVSGVPRTADGNPNLEAPAPRTVDGKPDLSGLWEFRNSNGETGELIVRNSTAASTASQGLGPNPTAGTSQFFNIASGLKDGLPFTPWAAEVRRKRMADNNKDNPDAHCLPIGLIQLNTHPQPRRIIQTPNLIAILYEANGGVRQIFLDGRTAPNNDAQPWWYGYSVGHWEGDTLVVETTGFRDDVWLDVEGSPLTETGKIVERIRRPNYGSIQIEVTVSDPKAYTKPWTVKLNHKIMLDTDLIEFVCLENERDAPHLVNH
jgi:hypothetical protein